MRRCGLAFVVAAVVLWLAGAAEAADTLQVTIQKMGGHPCRVGPLTCVSVEVPVDHRANAGPTMKIEFAVSFASEQSKGVLFYAVGGPGGSGIEVAADYLAAFDERFARNMDVVFFDQRGVGPDHGMKCPNAQAVFDLTEVSVDRPDAAIAAARTFATDCVAELKSPDLL